MQLPANESQRPGSLQSRAKTHAFSSLLHAKSSSALHWCEPRLQTRASAVFDEGSTVYVGNTSHAAITQANASGQHRIAPSVLTHRL
jgi:hypothetical protein